MKNKPLVSVVIPCYNEEKYLPACLQAFKKQTLTDFEIIVVDNNCIDNTAQIAKQFGARVVKEKKQGMTPAREQGFADAKAEIMAKTDADTIVASNWIEIISKTFQKYPEIVGITGSLIPPSQTIFNKLTSIYPFIASHIGLIFSGYIYLVGPSFAVRKSAWQKIKVCMDDRLVHEDIDLSVHLSEIGKLLYVPEMKAAYSLRKIEQNTVKGLYSYLVEYLWRFLKMIYFHKFRWKKKS